MLQALDETGRLCLFEEQECPDSKRHGLFALYKDDDEDRMIVDARRGNTRERKLTRWVRTLATAIAVLRWYLPWPRVFAQFGDDLVEYYNDFFVTRARARMHGFAGNWDESSFTGLSALRAAELEGQTAPF